MILAAPAVLAAGCTAASRPAPSAQPPGAQALCGSPEEIRHVVTMRFKPGVTQEQKDEVKAAFFALQHECKRNGQPYVLSVVGGECGGSWEGLNNGFEQLFIVTFKNADDFSYYLGPPFAPEIDPAHTALKKLAAPLFSVDERGNADGAVVFDFRPWVSPRNC